MKSAEKQQVGSVSALTLLGAVIQVVKLKLQHVDLSELRAASHVLLVPRCLPTVLPTGQASSPPLRFTQWQRTLDCLSTNNWGLCFQMQDKKVRRGYRNIQPHLCAPYLSLTHGACLCVIVLGFWFTWSCIVKAEDNFNQSGKSQFSLRKTQHLL